MKGKLLGHLTAFVIVAILLVGFLFVTGSTRSDRSGVAEGVPVELMPFVDEIEPESRFERTLLQDALEVYYPGRDRETSELAAAILRYKEQQFLENIRGSQNRQGLSLGKVLDIAGMYLKFLFVYIVVMILTYYGVQTLGTWWFVRRKRRIHSSMRKDTPKTFAKYVLFETTGILAMLVLFSPAYVIAYAIRTEFNTDTLFFLIILAVISNGLLVTYAHKFYTFLLTESRKGYVETAIAKNLRNSYLPESPDGISNRSIVRPKKHFHGHVFGHIFENARRQYLAAIKEQASFLITGLIIIEMALNMHGYLSYELLRQMLYGNAGVVVFIILVIFFTVKLTEITTDLLIYRDNKRYANKGF